MLKNSVFYIIVLILLIPTLFFFRRSYNEFNDYALLVQRHNTVQHYFQNLSGLIANAAVINPELIKAGVETSLFFADSISINRQLILLKSTVRDSVNIHLVNQLEPLIISEFRWLLKSNVPDSVLHHKAAYHIKALKNINLLIKQGLKRTTFLIDYSQEQLKRTITKIIVWMIVFIILSAGIIFYISIHFFRQKTKAKSKEIELQKNEIHFYNTLNNMLEGFQIIDHEFRYLFVNNTVVKQSKYSREELIGFTMMEKYPGIEHTALFKIIRKCLTDKVPSHFENEFTFPDHSKGWFELNIQAVAEGISILSVDITERKKSEQQHLLFSSIIQSSNDAILSKNLDGIITSWNYGAEKVFGYTAAEITGKHISILIPEHFLNEEQKIIEKIRKGEAIELYETQRIRKNGTIFYTSLSISPIKDVNGTILGASKIIRDITRQKKAEQELKWSTKEIIDYKYALDESSIVAITDRKGIITYVNENFCKISKYNREELIGKDHRIINSGYHDKEFIRNIWTTIAKGKIWKGELKNKAKDGTIYWVDTTIVPFLNEEGKPYQYVAIRSDITERKQTEENLKLSLKETKDYKYALDESSIVAITDQKGIIKYANDNFCKISKYNREELIGKDHRIINSGYHDKEFIRNIWTTIAKGKIWKGELKNKAKDGTIYWVDTTIVPFLNEDGKPYQYVAIRSDITERKQTEENLKLSLKETKDYKYALDESSIVAITDQKGIIKYANDNFCKISKYNREELIGKDHRIINSGYHDKEFIRNIWTTIASGKIWKGELKNKAKDSTIYWVDTTIVPFLDDNGKPYQYVAIRADITERKKSEEKLYQLNEELDQKVLDRTNELLLAKNQLQEAFERVRLLASIAENIQDPIISSDNNFTITNWNKAAEKLFEWKSEEVLGKNTTEVLKTQLPHQSRSQILAELNEKDFWQGEVIYSSKSGTPINSLVTVSHLKDKDENISGNLILVKDITERIKLEKLLKEFEHFFNNSNDLSCIANNEGYFEIINPSFEKMLGYTIRDFFEQPFINFVHPDDVAHTLQEYKKLKFGENVIHFYNRYRKKDGTYLLLDWNSTPNPITGKIYCIARDITDRKKAEDALRNLNAELEHIVAERTEKLINSEKQYRHLFQNNPMCMWVLDLSNFQFLDVNQMAIMHYGYSREEFLSMNSLDIRPEEEKESFLKIDRTHKINTDNYNKGIWKHKKKNGTIIQVEIFAHEIFFEGKQARIILSVDITKRLEAEVLLAENLKELERSNAELEQFAYIASHDLQEPLRMVGSYLQLLQRRYKGKLDKDADEFIYYAVDGATRMKRLINDLLNYSRMNKEGSIGLVNLNHVIKEVMQNLSSVINESNATVTCDDMPVIPAEKTQMVQLFQNLISNAIKFSREGVKVIININSKRRDDTWLFSITDNGIGIDPQYAEKVFIVFKQLHTKAKYGGTGIGLAIAKKIVERHGGKIWFESEPGKGTTFYFTLNLIN